MTNVFSSSTSDESTIATINNSTSISRNNKHWITTIINNNSTKFVIGFFISVLLLLLLIFINIGSINKSTSSTIIGGGFKREKASNIIYSIGFPYSRYLQYNSTYFGNYIKSLQYQMIQLSREIRNLYQIQPLYPPSTKPSPILESQSSTLNSKLLSSTLLTKPKIITIVSQLLVGKGQLDKLYYLDLLTTIQMNLLNPFVLEYHLLQMDHSYTNDIMSLMMASEKVKIHLIGKQLLNELDFIKYCNSYLINNNNGDDRIIVYLNHPDVYFDNTLLYMSKIENGQYVKIHKRINLEMEYNCNIGQANRIQADGIAFRTSGQQVIELPSSSLTQDDEQQEQTIRNTIVQFISQYYGGSDNDNCEVSKRVNAWFLHEPSRLDYESPDKKV